MGFYASMKRNEVVIYCTARMNIKTRCYVKETRHKRSQIYESLYMEFPQESNPYRQNSLAVASG